MKKLISATVIAAAGLALWTSPASAHTPTVTGNCSGVSVELKYYEQGSTVSVTIDGTTTSTVFGTDYKHLYPTDATKAHTYSVVVDNRGDGMDEEDKYDSTHSGTIPQCEQPPTTTVTAPLVIRHTNTTAELHSDCSKAWILFVNNGDLADEVVVSGRKLAVPAFGYAQLTLVRLDSGKFQMGPVASTVTGSAVAVKGANSDALGDVEGQVCIDTAVQDTFVPPVEQPPVLAFTGAKTNVLAALGAMILGLGVVFVALGRKIA